jgi:hypothetical protein
VAFLRVSLAREARSRPRSRWAASEVVLAGRIESVCVLAVGVLTVGVLAVGVLAVYALAVCPLVLPDGKIADGIVHGIARRTRSRRW